MVIKVRLGRLIRVQRPCCGGGRATPDEPMPDRPTPLVRQGYPLTQPKYIFPRGMIDYSSRKRLA
jgi:hypothetical protein